MKKLLLLVLMVGVSGCVTPEQAQKNKEDKLRREIESFQRQCDIYGFHKGTNEYAICIKELTTKEQNLKQMQSNLLIQHGMGVINPQPKEPDHFMCNPFGVGISCTSY